MGRGSETRIQSLIHIPTCLCPLHHSKSYSNYNPFPKPIQNPLSIPNFNIHTIPTWTPHTTHKQSIHPEHKSRLSRRKNQRKKTRILKKLSQMNATIYHNYIHPNLKSIQNQHGFISSPNTTPSINYKKSHKWHCHTAEFKPYKNKLISNTYKQTSYPTITTD